MFRRERTKIKMNEESLPELWNSIKNTNIRIIKIPEGEETVKRAESLCKKITAQNFPNLGKYMNI